jgi:hypothetical protein
MSEAMYPTHPILIIDVEAICWLLVNAILRQFGLNNIIIPARTAEKRWI